MGRVNAIAGAGLREDRLLCTCLCVPFIPDSCTHTSSDTSACAEHCRIAFLSCGGSCQRWTFRQLHSISWDGGAQGSNQRCSFSCHRSKLLKGCNTIHRNWFGTECYSFSALATAMSIRFGERI
jgi:hypothetical protein